MLTLFQKKSESARIQELEIEVQALRQELQVVKAVIIEELKAQIQEAQATIQALDRGFFKKEAG